MSCRLYELLTFGRFAPATARRRLWVPPGRPMPVSRHDHLTLYIDRVNDVEQVIFSLRGPAAGAWMVRDTVLVMHCEPLNFRICARALSRDASGRIDAVFVDLINLQLAALAS